MMANQVGSLVTVQLGDMRVQGELDSFTQESMAWDYDYADGDWREQPARYGQWQFTLTPRQIDNSVCVVYNDNNESEETMSLAKRYELENLDERVKKAVEAGAMTEDGVLTREGESLLVQILLGRKDIADEFYKAIDRITKEEEDE